MKIKISDATPSQLNYLVAKCEWNREEGDWCGAYNADYIGDPSCGVPIIEREGISLLYLYVTDDPFRWAATQKPSIKNLKPNSIYGPTLIIAAMRCYVASKLGDEVEIPEELQ